MGLYTIPCRVCGVPFLWFSGSLDQRCAKCKAAELPKKDPL